MALGKFLAPLNGQMIQQQVNKPYVDDIFDPLFNAEVTNYYRRLYGPLGGIGAGYASMLENALTGKKGILGPGMGILSTFGRSMDKADDFILGGLTEGVNTLGQITGGTNEAPQNPFRRIFVDDYDYQGTKLMAAAGNAMAKLAGVNTPLTEQDFTTVGDKVAGMSLDLATDPGIMGGQLARLNKGTPVGQVGQILNTYDDVVANVAGNMAFPGGKALIGKGLTRIRDFLGGASSTSPIDMVTKHEKTPIFDYDSGITSYSDLNPDTLTTLKKMSDDITSGINPIDDPELYAIKEEIDGMTGYLNPSELTKYQQDLAAFNNIEIQRRAAKDEAVQRIINTANKQREDIAKSSFEGMEKHLSDFQKGKSLGTDINPEITYFDDDFNEVTKRLNDLDEQELLNYVRDNFADYGQTDYYGNPLEYGRFYEDVKYRLENDGLEEARNMVLNKIDPNVREISKSNFTFAPNRMGFQSGIAKDTLDVINYHFENFLRKHPKGLFASYLRGLEGLKYIPTKDVFEPLVKYGKGMFTNKKGFITGTTFQDLLDVLYSKRLGIEDNVNGIAKEISGKNHSFIPWVKENANVLRKTKLGRDLIALADNLEKDVFDNNLYEIATKHNGISSVASFNEEFNGKDYDKYFDEFSDEAERYAQNTEIDVLPNAEYGEIVNPAKMLNQYLSKTEFTPEDFAQYAKDFPYLDLKVSQEYIQKSPEYAAWAKKVQPVLDKISKEKDLREELLRVRNLIDAPHDRLYEPSVDYEYFNALAQEYRKLNPTNLKPDEWLEKQRALIESIKRAPTDLEKQLEQYYTPAKKEYWKKLRGSPYAYDYTNLTPSNIYDAAKKVMVAPKPKDYSKIAEGLATFNPDAFSKEITSNLSFQDNIALDTYEKVFDQFKMDWDLPNDMPYYSLEPYIKKFADKPTKTLFQQWSAAMQSKVKNKLKTTHGALHVDIVKKSKAHVDAIKDSGKYSIEQIEEYISRKDLAAGVTLSGDNFLESIWASQGFKEFPVPKNMTQAQADMVAAALKQNVDAVNKNGNILKFIDVTGEDKVRRIAVAFDIDNLNIKKDLNKIYSLFGKKDLGLKDVVLRGKAITKTSWDSTELDDVFNEIRQGTEELGTKLGFNKFDPDYIAHVRIENKDVGDAFSEIYKTLGLDKKKLEQVCDALQQQDIASGKLAFGSIPMERSHLGYFGQYKTKFGASMFSTDLSKIHSDTFTQGMFENSNAQTFFDLFVSDNFKIQNNFDDVATLKKALNLTEGNLNNLSIVKPRYSETGKLIGFTKYDKFSDAALAKAFADQDAILVPDAVIGSLDRMCKKDARMSNKVYAFINKYLTVPFKFGTLANPGFLAGNIQDAYFKQATELAKKYGTTVSDELTNVAFSMRQVTQLNNNFSDIFDEYKQWLKDTDLSTITRSDRPADWYLNTFKKSKNTVDTLTVDQIVSNPEMYGAFKQYISLHVPADKQKMANLYLYLNNNQTSTLFKNNNRDLENVTDLITDNPYAVPNNIFERIMYGDPSKMKVVNINGQLRQVQDRGFNSWGLFLNNPVSNRILKTSNTIENWMRSATILNDLQHQGYTIEDICEILGTDKTAEKTLRAKFNMSMNEALNTMYAANFDYDNVSEVMNKASYILPFPTFYLKNLAFWADIFTNKPQYIDNVLSVHENLWSGKDTSKDEFTAEAKGRGAVPVGQQNKHLTGIVKQTPYNSMFGAFNAVNNFKEDFAYRTNPVLRPIARHLQKPEDVKYRPYNTQQFQKNIKQDDKDFSELAYMFHQLNPYERFINTGLRTPGKVANNTYQMSDFLPSMFQPDFSKKSSK